MSKVLKRTQNKDVSYGKFYEEFERRCKLKYVSDATLTFYRNNLVHFERYLIESGIKFIGDVNKDVYDMFVLFLSEKYSNSVTINTYLRATKTFLRYAMNCDYISEFEINIVKPDEYVKETYSEDDIQKLIKKSNLKTCSFVEYRNWVLVQYLLETGNRVNTFVRIKVKDIDFDNGLVLLYTPKNHKHMYFPLGTSMMKILCDYIHTWDLVDDDWLFPNCEKCQLTRGLASKSIARYNKQRGVQITSLHAFRHTFAKNYIMNGGSAFKLQRLLGHSTLKVTQMYVNLFSTDLKQDFEKFSIVEKYSHNSKMKRKTS